jgi:hypothetical protein
MYEQFSHILQRGIQVYLVGSDGVAVEVAAALDLVHLATNLHLIGLHHLKVPQTHDRHMRNSDPVPHTVMSTQARMTSSWVRLQRLAADAHWHDMPK